MTENQYHRAGERYWSVVWYTEKRVLCAFNIMQICGNAYKYQKFVPKNKRARWLPNLFQELDAESEINSDNSIT